MAKKTKAAATPKKAKTAATPKMTEKQAIVLAAIFARTNMGMSNPSARVVSRVMSHPVVSLDGAVVAFCQEFMESDEHYDIFMDEARGWLEELKKQSMAEALEPHRDMAYLLPLLTDQPNPVIPEVMS